MDPGSIAKLLQPFLLPPPGPCHSEERSPCHSEERSDEESAVLSPTQLQSISTYIDILLRWNARINLTAIRDPEEIVTRHFGESLFAARRLFPSGFPSAVPSGFPNGFPSGRAALQGRVTGQGELGALAPAPLTLADVGSGAGFPGLPIKIWAPHITLTLIESHHKKATFLREVTRALTLTDVNIQNTRAEALAGATFDTVTLRAVEHFESILPTAANLVAPGGRLALLIATPQQAPARSTLPEFLWGDPEPVPLSRSRVLVISHRQ